MANQRVVNMSGAKEIGEKTNNLYREWLAASGLSEDDFIKQAGGQKKLKVRKNRVNGNTSIEVGYYDTQNIFHRVGLNFICVSNSKSEQEEFKVNICFLLLFMAARLDEVYKDKYGKDYYFNIFKNACISIV